MAAWLPWMPALEFNIRGVTFDNRQEHVQQLQQGQVLQLVPEPHNAFDPDAIAIMTADGVQLGYVPRERTGQVAGHADCRVVSLGPVQNGGAAAGGQAVWGCRVAVDLPVPNVAALLQGIQDEEDAAGEVVAWHGMAGQGQGGAAGAA